MRFKSAQISIFIIIAVLIIFLVVFLVLFGEENKIETQSSDIDSEEIKINLDSCFENSYYNSLYNIAYHGGNFDYNDEIVNTPKDLLNFSNRNYYFYLVNENLVFPTLEDLEYEFESGISYYFDNCLNNLEIYDLEYDYSEMRIEIDFMEDNSMEVEGKLDIIVGSQDSKISLNSFSYVDTYSSFLEMYRLAKKISKEQSEHPLQVCLSCLTDFQKEYNFDLYYEELISIDSTTYIYTIVQEDSEYNDAKIFMFAHFNNQEVEE